MADITQSADAQKISIPEKMAVNMPAIPIVAVNASEAAILMPDGELLLLSHTEAKKIIAQSPAIVCHAPFTKAKLKTDAFFAFDILELFAFTHPAKFCVPTPVGLAKALGQNLPQEFEDYPLSLFDSVRALLGDLQDEYKDAQKNKSTRTSSPQNFDHTLPGETAPPSANQPPDLLDICATMGFQGKGWAWTPFIFASLNQKYDSQKAIMAKSSLNIWRYLPSWAEDAPPPPPSHHPVTGDEARERLRALLDSATHKTEPRPQQVEYATRLTASFAPGNDEDDPHIVLAEAGTGVGKTLGYIAPASVWAEKNAGTVWISTYTRNLQRQIDQELNRLYPDPDVKARKIAIRKGRENYLCLLNLEDMVAGAAMAKTPAQAVAAGIMARWAEYTKDGDLSGGDFPGWLPGLIGGANSIGLADRRGECIFSACDHYHKCFVEKAIRKSKRASIVVANHALVMIQTALSGPESDLPQRYVFDEGHHLFDAADSAFSSHLTAWETADLRRWILGPENTGRSRARGLKKRVDDLLNGDTACIEALEDILQAAHSLPGHGWSRRLKDKNPLGATEQFLAHVHQQVFARSAGQDGPYSLETETRPLIDGLRESATALKTKLRALQKPILILAAKLHQRIEDQAATLDSDTKKRLDAISSTLIRRGEITIGSWIAMLETLEQTDQPPDFIDWMEVERNAGQASDVGLYRHWIDPMRPFAVTLKKQAQGIAITSATLLDGTGDQDADWRAAIERSGACYLSDSPQTLSLPSPYDYAHNTLAIVITDIRKNDLSQISSAYQVLFEAAGGGALGLFTAITRLRAVYDKIHLKLEKSGIPLYAQHVDEIDTGTLVDIFREDRHACLLGTDAVRDGIDVPGDSLRMLVYDRVPWPRPTILHKARRNEFGGRRYDEMSTRLKLRQAFGRLIRRADDRGVFVMLDSMLPSRLHGAFPDGVTVRRMGLAQAVDEIKQFLADDATINPHPGQG